MRTPKKPGDDDEEVFPRSVAIFVLILLLLLWLQVFVGKPFLGAPSG